MPLNTDVRQPASIGDLVQGVDSGGKNKRNIVWNNHFYNVQLYAMGQDNRLTIDTGRISTWSARQRMLCVKLEGSPSQAKGMIPVERYKLLVQANIYRTKKAEQTLKALRPEWKGLTPESTLKKVSEEPRRRRNSRRARENVMDYPDDIVEGLQGCLQQSDQVWNKNFQNAQLYVRGRMKDMTVSQETMYNWLARQRVLCRKLERGEKDSKKMSTNPARYALMVKAKLHEAASLVVKEPTQSQDVSDSERTTEAMKSPTEKDDADGTMVVVESFLEENNESERHLATEDKIANAEQHMDIDERPVSHTAVVEDPLATNPSESDDDTKSAVPTTEVKEDADNAGELVESQQSFSEDHQPTAPDQEEHSPPIEATAVVAELEEDVCMKEIREAGDASEAWVLVTKKDEDDVENEDEESTELKQVVADIRPPSKDGDDVAEEDEESAELKQDVAIGTPSKDGDNVENEEEESAELQVVADRETPSKDDVVNEDEESAELKQAVADVEPPSKKRRLEENQEDNPSQHGWFQYAKNVLRNFFSFGK